MPRKPSRSQWVHLVRRAVVQSSLAGLLVWTVSTAQVQTDITPDGTMGTEVTQTGTIHDIAGGTRPDNGQNLFHSFDRFNVGTGDTANFASDPGVDNIISRVTGGAESMIDGTLQAEANLFLLNPQGILFGPHATLNVNGSFHASTADELRFADGATFSARLSERTTLTVAAPSAFGFLSENPAGIAIQGSKLALENGNLSLVGGDMRIERAALISTPGGQVNVVSVASSGDVVLGPQSTIEIESFDQLGEIEIIQDSQIDISGPDGGGKVFIRGGRLVIDNAVVEGGILDDMSGDRVGIDIDISDEVVLTNGAVIRTRADEAGRHAADIHVVTGDLQMENFSLITSLTSSQGDAGDVAVDVENVTAHAGSQISSFTIGPGNGGAVTVHATNITLEGATPDNSFLSGLFANTQGQEDGAGDAGTILIEANQLTLSGGAQIASATFGPGNGGAVTVRATNITLEGATPDNRFLSGLFVTSEGKAENTGDAGTILVVAGQLTLSDGAQIASATVGPGNGGAVTVHATNITLEGATPDNSFLSGLFANTQGQEDGAGDAGTILVVADQLTLSGGARINSLTFGPGNGGAVTVHATNITLEGATPDNSFVSGLFVTSAGKAENTGDAGTILIEADQLTLSGGAQIASATVGPGNGGAVTVRATNITLEGATPDNSFPSGLFVTSAGKAENTGDAGTILIEANQLTIAGGARINSTTFGPGHGGAVTVRAKEITLDGATSDNFFPSGILAGALGEGDAGTILIEADQLALVGGARISSTTFGPGNGGAVTVHATNITLEGATPDNSFLSGLFANTQGQEDGAGDAGTILVVADQLTLSDGAQIASASTRDGQGGDIFIRGNRIQLIESATISSESFGTGDAGNIRITAQEVDLRDNSAITTTVNQGEAGGGNILIGGTITDHGDITTGIERLTLEGSRITANTDAGDGANIAIGARQVVLDGNSDVTANTDAGIGGNVTIAGTVAANGQALTRAEAIVLRDSQITAQADEGKGGRIDIVAEAVLADPDSEIDASSQAGIDGEVNIEAVRTNLSEIVTPLSPHFAQTAALLRDPCASRLQRGIVSSFVARGRNSVPATPDGLLPSRLYSRATDPAESESAGPREALALNSHVRLSRRPCP